MYILVYMRTKDLHLYILVMSQLCQLITSIRIGVLLKVNKSRAISTTRTIFRLNTSQGHAYEDYMLRYLVLIAQVLRKTQTKLIARTPSSNVTSSQYPSEIKFTVTYLFTITSNSFFMQSNYRLQSILYPILGDQLNFAILHPFVEAYVARLQPTIFRP